MARFRRVIPAEPSHTWMYSVSRMSTAAPYSPSFCSSGSMAGSKKLPFPSG